MNTRTALYVAIYTVSAVIVIGVFALLPSESRQSELDRFILTVPAIVAGLPGLLSYLQGKRNHDTLQVHASEAAANAAEVHALLREGNAPGTGKHAAPSDGSV